MKMKKLWIYFVAALPLAESTVLIVDSAATRRRGKLRSALLSELSGLAKDTGITHACIHASSVGSSGFKLVIVGVPDALKQRVRNVWGANWQS